MSKLTTNPYEYATSMRSHCEPDSPEYRIWSMFLIQPRHIGHGENLRSLDLTQSQDLIAFLRGVETDFLASGIYGREYYDYALKLFLAAA